MQIKPITYNLAVDEPAGLFVLSCQRILIEIKISSERKVLPFQTVPFFNLQNDKIWHKNRAFTVAWVGILSDSQSGSRIE